MFNNNEWQRRTRLPHTEARITQAYFISKDIRRELEDVIHREESKKASPIAALLSSWREAEGRLVPDGFSAVMHTVSRVETPADISARLGWMNRFGMPSPLSISIQGDPRERKRCRVFIDEGGIMIGSAEYWWWREFAGTRHAYKVYVERLAELLAMPSITQGFTAEQEYTHFYPTDRPHDRPLNMLTWSELRSAYPRFDWVALVTNYGLAEEQAASLMYNVASPEFLRHFHARLVSWSISRWQGWFALFAAQWIAGRSPHGPLRRAWFDYTRHFQQGLPSDNSPAELRSGIIQMLMPNTIGRLWVRDYCKPGLRSAVSRIVEHVRCAAIHNMHRVSWMSESTRVAAVTKLRAMDIQVCWPDPWEEPDIPGGISPDNYIENLLAVAAYTTDISIDQLRRGCQSPLGNGWGKPVYEVNAYYYPAENRFLLPAAILRPPFYDSAKSRVWNYGAIGVTIGHELCHAFDADGREYDAKGNKRDWWTERDNREYKRKTRRIVRLFESRKYRGMNVNGSLTLVENIADLGGLDFSLAALAADLGRALTSAELREFFTAYAITWRSKDRKRKASQLILMDPHAPPSLRVNHIVRQFDEWYTAFGVPEDCPDYIPPSERIRFFR
jgi:putative endopeptidase